MKRKRKPRQISLPGADPVPQSATGRDRTGTNKPQDALETALQARARVLGVRYSVDERRALSDALCGSEMGLCIRHINPDTETRALLWDAWQAISAARRNYRERIIGMSGSPQGAAIAMVPDAMQTDQSHTVDVRTADERDDAAIRAEAYWREMIAALPRRRLRSAIRVALDEIEGALWRDCAPTARGANAVAALVVIADMREW